MKVWEHTACGPVRSVNEDAARSAVWPGGGVAVVADGMGSSSFTDAGQKVAHAICVFYAVSSAEDRLDPAAMPEALKRARDQLDDDGGCTLAILVADGPKALVGWLGDCRVYRQRGRTLERLTTDHTLVAEMVARGEISEVEALSHPHRHIVLRAFQADFNGQVEVREVAIEAGDRFLLATDGAWRPLELWTLQRHMMVEDADLPGAAEAVVAAAHAEDGSDNAAAAVALLRGRS